MKIENKLISLIEKHHHLTAPELAKHLKVSRQYVTRLLKKLVNQKIIFKTGSTKNSLYHTKLPQDNYSIKSAIKNLQEDVVFTKLNYQLPILSSLSQNLKTVFEYSFTEILNNAIDHSLSHYTTITITNSTKEIGFIIKDSGVGIFNNLVSQKKLKNHLEAIQDLTKGKLTTIPSRHTGEGIFFTSKLADIFTIKSSYHQLIFNNIKKDNFIKKLNRKITGTQIEFSISKNSPINLSRIFKEYTNKDFQFYKTKITVKLYQLDTQFISRSQAKRLLSGLNSFTHIILDFKKINLIGQGFADEIFRVFQSQFPQTLITPINASPTISFFIKKATNPKSPITPQN